MRLFIAEKPELARVIAKGLGGGKTCDGYIDCGNDDWVTYCFGHMLTLYEPEDYDPRFGKWNLGDLPIIPVTWKKKVIKDKAKQLKVIFGLMKQADVVVSAGDADAEGEYLIREIRYDSLLA